MYLPLDTERVKYNDIVLRVPNISYVSNFRTTVEYLPKTPIMYSVLQYVLYSVMWKKTQLQNSDGQTEKEWTQDWKSAIEILKGHVTIDLIGPKNLVPAP